MGDPSDDNDAPKSKRGRPSNDTMVDKILNGLSPYLLQISLIQPLMDEVSCIKFSMTEVIKENKNLKEIIIEQNKRLDDLKNIVRQSIKLSTNHDLTKTTDFYKNNDNSNTCKLASASSSSTFQAATVDLEGEKMPSHENKFTTVRKKKNRKKIVRGNQENISGLNLSGVSRIAKVCVRRLSLDTTDKSLTNYLNTLNVPVHAAELLKSPNYDGENFKPKFKSFKILINASDLSTVYDESKWPNYVEIKPFFAKFEKNVTERRLQTTNKSSPEQNITD